MEMFTIPLEQINYEKIEAFCKEQIAEGETIEYKSDFPSDLEKSISAMANTYGGIILIGVKADKIRNVPILPIEGRDLVEGLEEKVTSICLGKIYPPYFPLVKICPLPNEKGENKCVVFIRVYESNQTPHAINNNTDVYLRIKSQNEPFRKATVDEIEWLKDKRRKAVEFRESILIRADERYEVLSARFLDMERRPHFRKSFLVPLYCSHELVSSFNLLNYFKPSGITKFDSEVEYIKNNAKTANETFYFFQSIPNNSQSPKSWVSYREFTSFGLVYHKESLWEDCYVPSRWKFDVLHFLDQIYITLKLGLLLYDTVGFDGVLKVGILIQGLRGKEIGRRKEHKMEEIDCFLKNELDDNFAFNRDILKTELAENLHSIIMEMYRQFLFACGLGKDQDMLNELCIKHYNWIKNRYNIET
jgi:hypothetical protein